MQGENYQVQSSTWPLKVQLPTTTQETNVGLDEARLEDEKHSWGCARREHVSFNQLFNK